MSKEQEDNLDKIITSGLVSALVRREGVMEVDVGYGKEFTIGARLALRGIK